MLLSVRIPSDLVVETCFIGMLFIKSSRDSDSVLSFCLEPININSVLVEFKVSHLWMLLKSRFRLDCIECKSALALCYVGVACIHPRLAERQTVWQIIDIDQK